MTTLARISVLALASITTLTLSACGGGGPAAQGDGVLTIGATPVPHGQILAFIDEELAPEAGLDIEVVEYTDYVQPNVALSEGELDANFFQHLPYFESEVAEKGYDFDHSPAIHIEPYGVYSEKVTDLADLPQGATVTVPNDPSNQSRAMELLAAEGVFTLEDVEEPTLFTIADNPKDIQVEELDAPQLPRSLEDVDAAVINGNFALEAGLVPNEDALALESGQDNPYSNVVAFRAEDAEDEDIKKLQELLTSEETRAFIEETWPNGEVQPAF